jgi:beta-galactosidase
MPSRLPPALRAVPVALSLFAVHAAPGRPSDDVLPLDGTWRFELDRSDEGIAAGWERRSLAHSIKLPGALQAQRYGDDVSLETK